MITLGATLPPAEAKNRMSPALHFRVLSSLTSLYSLHCVSTYCNENILVQCSSSCSNHVPLPNVLCSVMVGVPSAHNAALNQVQCRLTKGAAIRHHHIPLSLKTRSLLISHPRHIAAGSAPCISCAQQNLVMDLGTEKCLNALN